MKTSLAFVILSTKLTMLVCVSFMSSVVMFSEVSAEKIAPCHQEIILEIKEEKQPSCNTCEIAFDAWAQKAIPSSKLILTKVNTVPFTVDNLWKNLSFELRPLKDIYQDYSPPQEAIFKTVAPNTKTIVLLV